MRKESERKDTGERLAGLDGSERIELGMKRLFRVLLRSPQLLEFRYESASHSAARVCQTEQNEGL